MTKTHHRVPAAAIAVVVLAVGGGCAARKPAAVRVVDMQQNRQRIELASGSRLEVHLPGPYWQLGPVSQPRVLTQDGPLRTVPQPAASCPPGRGCGVERVSFTAHDRGSSVITASRTSCGEAMRCTGDQGSFQLTVVVR